MKLSTKEKRQIAYQGRIESLKRANLKRIAFLRSPEGRAAMLEKQRKYAEKAKQRKISKPQKKIKSKGLKGRTPTAQEKKIMDAIGLLPCIACFKHGRITHSISLHHVYGRTIDNCHALVLPLCAYHHNVLVDEENRSRYPDLIPVHAQGKYGGKAAFSKLNGTEQRLLKQVYSLIGLTLPQLP